MNRLHQFDFTTYFPPYLPGHRAERLTTNQKFVFKISSFPLRAEVNFHTEKEGRLLSNFKLLGGIASSAAKVHDATETVTWVSAADGSYVRQVEHRYLGPKNYKQEKSTQLLEPGIVTISEAPWVFAHAWRQLQRIPASEFREGIEVKYNDGSKTQSIALFVSETARTQAEVFLMNQSDVTGGHKMLLDFTDNRLALFGANIPLLGAVRFTLDGH